MTYCPACGTETPKHPRYAKAGFSIVACDRCGLGSTVLPPAFDPAAIYTAGYFEGTGEHSGVQGYANYGVSEPVLRREFRHALHALTRFAPPRNGATLVEIGGAYGFFLEEARAQYRAIGVEISEAAIARGRERGLAMYHASDPSWQAEGPFDAAVMLDTIEHVACPDETLGTLAQVVRPGGALLLTTGDWHSLYARLSGKYWRLMTPPQHLYFYTVPTVTALLERHGFRVRKITHPWKTVPIGLALYQLGRSIGIQPKHTGFLNRVGVPVNLFDAMRIIAERVTSSR